MALACVVEVFDNGEAFAVCISRLGKKPASFFAVCGISFFAYIHVVAAYCAEVVARCTLGIVDAARDESGCGNLTCLCDLLDDVVTVDSEAECLTHADIIKRRFLCLEAYIICSDVRIDVEFAGLEQSGYLRHRDFFNEVELARLICCVDCVSVVHQLEIDGLRAKLRIVVVCFGFDDTDVCAVLPAFHLVRTVADIGIDAECPLVAAGFNHILTYGHERRESHDFLEIGAGGVERDNECALVDGLYAEGGLIGFARHYLVCVEKNVCHVAVVCCCCRIYEALPGIYEIVRRDCFTVAPLCILADGKRVDGLIIVDLNVRRLAERQSRVAIAVVYPLVETFKHVVDHDCAVHCAVERGVDSLRFRCKVDVKLEVFVNGCAGAGGKRQYHDRCHDDCQNFFHCCSSLIFCCFIKLPLGKTTE